MFKTLLEDSFYDYKSLTIARDLQTVPSRHLGTEYPSNRNEITIAMIAQETISAITCTNSQKPRLNNRSVTGVIPSSVYNFPTTSGHALDQVSDNVLCQCVPFLNQSLSMLSKPGDVLWRFFLPDTRLDRMSRTCSIRVQRAGWPVNMVKNLDPFLVLR